MVFELTLRIIAVCIRNVQIGFYFCANLRYFGTFSGKICTLDGSSIDVKIRFAHQVSPFLFYNRMEVKFFPGFDGSQGLRLSLK